jgi:hypothetical protein
MTPIEGTNITEWLIQVWPGNPDLGLKCSAKYFTNPHTGRKVPVFVHGGISERPSFYFTVSAGANSNYSYSGLCKDVDNIKDAQAFIDQSYTANTLFK